MKLKKLLISASAIAAGSGLLATALVSCGSNSVDDELKINLQSDASFLGKLSKADYKTAVVSALSRSSGWATFKAALADEIVWQWYENRAATSSDTKDKNLTFRNFLDQAKYDVDKDYKTTIDDLKAKYGSNYQFYLQNQYLSPNGGTEESYKHAKIVEKVRADFITKVFATNYFGFALPGQTVDHPRFFTKVDTSPKPYGIRNSENWGRIGFFAKTNSSYTIDDMKDTNMLAKYPDGDYATIQDFVFNRWFATEKPFFSAAALFKYAAPKSATSLDKVYNGTKTKLPDSPNEAFPYFGGIGDTPTPENGSTTGAKAYVNWFEALQNGEFQKDGLYGDQDSEYNLTVSIPTKYTEDSQTLLLCFGNQMIAGSENTLYTPYAISAASLYNQMIAGTATGALKNTIKQEDIVANIAAHEAEYGPSFFDDDTRILRNFLYSALPGTPTIQSYIDLQAIYGGYNEITSEYHCPLFAKNDDFNFFYGAAGTSGIRYVTNNVQVNLKSTKAGTHTDIVQPWVMELNEAGMHAQTIDGYAYVAQTTFQTEEQRFNALKDVVKYRLLEQQCQFDKGMISASVLGSTGALSTYFSNNFTDIILEMATNEDPEINIFRTIESYKEEETNEDEVNFFNKVVNDQLFGVELTDVTAYLNATREIDLLKKDYDELVATNEKIYAYRSSQIVNSAVNYKFSEAVFANGLLAPIAVACTSAPVGYNMNHWYDVSTIILNKLITTAPTPGNIATQLSTLKGSTFVQKVNNGVSVDDKNNGFSPQVAEAKKTESNRFWYKSPLLDRAMYAFMGSNKLANQIKGETYEDYKKNAFAETDAYNFDNILPTEATAYTATTAITARASTYYASKLLTGTNNYASYGQIDDTDFFTTMNSAYANLLQDKKNTDGDYCDDELNQMLFNATVVFLAKNNFENFYKALNTKIGENEKAFIGYLMKYNTETHTWLWQLGVDPADQTTIDTVDDVYGWAPNVGNIFDDRGYSGGMSAAHYDRVNYSEYWQIVNNTTINKEIAGFLGVQTPSSNALGVCEELQNSAFDNFAKSVFESQSVFDATKVVDEDDGSLFAWSNPDTADCKTKYAVPEAKWGDKTITDAQFDDLPKARKLAKQIAMSSAIDDLKNIATQLDDALMNKGTVFYKISSGEFVFEDIEHPVDELRYKMLDELLTIDGSSGTLQYAKAFDRLQNVELRDGLLGDHCFENDADGYKLFLTQINKCDISEKALTPTFNSTTGWSMPEGTITMDEFWYIFCKMATESSNQQQAIADAVNKTFGDEKLVVYDAQLYNQFDSVWIKDWEKKPMGPEA